MSRDVAATPSRAAPVEVAAPAENDSSIKSWFSATFNALSGSSAPTTEAREPVANEAPRKRRVSAAERTESKAARAQQLPATAAETVQDKAVDTTSKSDSTSEPEWQKALYEEFLQWRVKRLMFE